MVGYDITPTMLKRAADATFDDRSRGQVMADALVERVTGRPADVPQPVALNLVMSDRTLFGRDGSPAVLEGYGPIPAGVARRLVDGAVGDKRSCATLQAALRSPDEWVAGGDGIAVAPFAAGVGDVYRVTRPDVSDAVL
jgi:hypothetical protein